MSDVHGERPPRNDIDQPNLHANDEADLLAQHYLDPSNTETPRTTPLQQTLGQSARFAAIQSDYHRAKSGELPTEPIPRVTTLTQAAAQSLRESYRQYKAEFGTPPPRAQKSSRRLGQMISKLFKR